MAKFQGFGINIGVGGIAIGLGIIALLIWFVLQGRFFKRLITGAPATARNLINAGPNALAAAISGIPDDTLGTALNRSVENITQKIKTLNPFIDKTVDPQVVKTCRAILQSRGFVRSSRCIDALRKSGDLIR